MIIERNVSKFCGFSEDSIVTVLCKISDNKSHIIISVLEYCRLECVLTGICRQLLTAE